MARRYFLVFLTFTWCLVAGQSPKYALKGNKVLLEPNIPKQPDAILWKHNGNKVIEFNGNEERIYSPYENRITLHWDSAALEIHNLRFEDSGEYELEADIKKRLHRSVHQLEVIDEVAKPTISCEMIDSGSSNKSGKLVCSAEPRRPQSLTKFEWNSNGKVQPGANLLIPLGEKHDDKVHKCQVSNPLSIETATFTAKDCHSDGSSVALIASLVGIFSVVLLVGLGVLFCMLRPKACFAKGDLEKQSPRGATEGSDKQTARGEKKSLLLHRESTLLSNQPLGHLLPGMGNMRQEDDADSDAEPVKTGEMDKQDEMPQKGHVKKMSRRYDQKNNNLPTKKMSDKRKEPASLPSTPPSEPPSPLDQNKLASSDKAYLDTDQLGEPTEGKVPQFDLSDSEKANEVDPARVSDDLNEDTNSDHSIAAEQPEPDKEADEDEDKEAKPAPSNAETPPVAQPRSPLTKSSPNMAPKDTAGEHKEDANSDQVTEETAEKNARESDSSGEEERNESDDSSKDIESPTVPEQKGSKTSLDKQELPQEAAHTSEDNQQETAKPVSEVESEKDSVGESEEATSPQPQSPPPTEPDNRNTDTSQKSPDAAHADPYREEEDKTSHDSEEQSDEGEGETVEDKNEVQSGPKEDKPDNESLSEDKQEQKKDEVVA